jgi:hypothetical protein
MLLLLAAKCIGTYWMGISHFEIGISAASLRFHKNKKSEKRQLGLAPSVCRKTGDYIWGV